MLAIYKQKLAFALFPCFLRWVTGLKDLKMLKKSSVQVMACHCSEWTISRSFNKYLLKAYYMPDTIICTVDKARKRQYACPCGAYILVADVSFWAYSMWLTCCHYISRWGWEALYPWADGWQTLWGNRGAPPSSWHSTKQLSLWGCSWWTQWNSDKNPRWCW